MSLRPDEATLDIAGRVREIARVHPAKVALVQPRYLGPWGPLYTKYTYGELSRRAEALSAGLARIGVGKGTLCSFMVPPSFDAMVIGVALWRLGAVVVGVEPHSHGLRKIAGYLEEVGPTAFFGTPLAHTARLAFGWGRSSVRTNVVTGPVAAPGMHSLRALERDRGDKPPSTEVDPDDVAAIVFTTGSTGRPKPTVLRHRNIAAIVSQISRQWGFDEEHEVVDMPTFPIFWFFTLPAAGTVVNPPMDFALKGPGSADPARLARTIRDCGVRSMFASPALLSNLSAYAHAHGITLPTIERIVAGGAEVPGPLFEAVKGMLGPQGEMYSDYGATEALPLSEIPGDEVVRETWRQTEQGAGLCAGTPYPDVEVRIIETSDESIPTWDQARELPLGEVGEVVARSPHFSEEYFRLPKAMADNKIADSGSAWHRMGDTGYLDDRGRLWLCGRKSHRVVTPSGTLYPLRCEPVFNAHPLVRNSALVGIDESGRTVPTLCVVPSGDALPGSPARGAAMPPGGAELVTALRAHAARFEPTRLIERFEILDALPVDRRHNAKIDRIGLSTRLGAKRAP